MQLDLIDENVCNCDIGSPFFTSDLGVLLDQDPLPVKAIVFEGTEGLKDAEAWLTLGPLVCDDNENRDEEVQAATITTAAPTTAPTAEATSKTALWDPVAFFMCRDVEHGTFGTIGTV
jgi:hypothetical protein